jgi:AraC-like DNA-binding protein
MSEIFAEILKRRIFSRAVFAPDVAHISVSVGRVASILRRLLANFEGGNHSDLLPDALLYNLARLVAHVWPSTNSQELRLSADEQPPLALRLALDYICSRRGMVTSVVDVASVTNVGLRALETLFRDRMSIGIKRYCKSVMLRHITEELESGHRTINQIALEFGVSNVSRLRWELGEYSRNVVRDLYPWEFYDIIRTQKAGIPESSQPAGRRGLLGGHALRPARRNYNSSSPQATYFRSDSETSQSDV